MNKIITDALCIRAEEYGESGKVLTLLTAEHGKLSAGIRGVKNPKSKLKAGATAPVFGEYELISKDGNRFTVSGISVKEGFYSCWESIDKYASAEVVLELADRASSDEGGVEQELVLTLRALSEINYGNHSPYVVILWYFLNIMAVIGEDFHDEEELPRRVMSDLDALANAEPEELETFEITPAVLVEYLRYMTLILKANLGLELRSMNEVFKLITK